LKQISVLNTPGDYKAHWIDILPNGALSFNRTVDFEAIFTKDRGGARPHSSVIYDLTVSRFPLVLSMS
jgi:selenium-binding protein 1